MTYFLIGILLIILLSAIFIWYGSRYDDIINNIIELIGVSLGVLSIIPLFIFMIFIIDYQSAGYKAKIMNKELGTEYTQEEIFYAEDLIKNIRKIKNK